MPDPYLHPLIFFLYMSKISFITYWIDITRFHICMTKPFKLFIRNLYSLYFLKTGPMLSSNYPPPTVGFMSASVLGAHHGGTLRRQREYDSTPPRILSKIDMDPQFYYGWQLPKKIAASSMSSANHEPTIGDEQANTTMCPPGRTYCF